MCVIGSGITGVSAAWHLVEGLKKRASEEEGEKGEGLDIVVLEARDFCSGATGTFAALPSQIPTRLTD